MIVLTIQFLILASLENEASVLASTHDEATSIPLWNTLRSVAANRECAIVGIADLECLVLAGRDRVHFCSDRATLVHGP